MHCLTSHSSSFSRTSHFPPGRHGRVLVQQVRGMAGARFTSSSTCFLLMPGLESNQVLWR